MAGSAKPPIVLVKWYEVVKWLLERVDNFPKSQRFIFGQRLADHSISIPGLACRTIRARNTTARRVQARGLAWGPCSLVWAI